ncbi:MAG: lipopolysaccharide kinase InaA family protein [Immundisolibacter sp.]
MDGFDAWWTLALDTVEPGNRRRGGWSTVGRHRLPAAVGGGGVFVKRQCDHVYRSLRHPWRGRLTAEREYRTLLRCARAGVAAAEPLLYAQARRDGHRCGVLVTRELAGYRSLDVCVAQWRHTGWPPLTERRRVLRAVAVLVRRLHAAHLQHNCLYPKHIMVSDVWLSGGDDSIMAPVALIDLEKAKWRLWRWSCARRDLDSLNRRSRGWSRTDRRRFLGYYLGRRGRLRGAERRLWRRLARAADDAQVAAASGVSSG